MSVVMIVFYTPEKNDILIFKSKTFSHCGVTMFLEQTNFSSFSVN